jgi:hypothetical protein
MDMSVDFDHVKFLWQLLCPTDGDFCPATGDRSHHQPLTLYGLMVTSVTNDTEIVQNIYNCRNILT